MQRSQYGKIHDLKAYAQAVNFLQDKNVTTLEQLYEVVAEMKKEYRNTKSRIKQTEKLLHERKELIDQSEKYLKYRPVYVEYKKIKPRKQERFYFEHSAELILYKTAERHLKKHLGNNTSLHLKQWKDEVAELTSQKNQLYDEVYELRDKVKEAEAVKKCVEQAIEPQKQRKERTRDKDIVL